MGIRHTTRNIFKATMVSLLFTAIVGLLTGLIVNQRFASIELDGEKLRIEPKPTRIYDAQGNKMAEFEKDRKEMTPYSEIPKEIIEGVVATEDREFFNHAGVNVRTIFRAVLVDLRSGSFEQGGSTVTQQLAKGIYLNPGKTLDRKIQEAVYATAIEKEYSKQDIIAFYLNHNFYGQRAYGVKNAIKTYFGMTIEEFEKQDKIDRIARSALLAGIPQSPSVLNPYANKEQAMQRRNTVLTNMYVRGYITREEYEAAKTKDFLVLQQPKIADDEQIHYPEYVHYVLSEASKILDMPIEEVMYSGVTLYTSFEPEVYKAMRQHMSNSSLYPTNPAGDDQKIQGASVFVNPQNGEIYAMTGSRDEITQFLSFNRAFQAKRGPGSSFKPIMDYGPALETGKWNPYSTVQCQSSFGTYFVKDHNCNGSKSMAEALRLSNNGPAVWMLQQVGIDYARAYVKKLGIDLTDNDVYLPIALGGLEYGVTPLEMADAYQVFANGGKRAEAHTIRRMVNYLDEVVYEPEQPKQVIRAEAADQMKSMLRSVVTNGTGRNAEVPGYKISGKTGTNENPSGHGNKDIWFAGFTDNMVGIVWMGFDNADSRHYIPSGQTSYIAAKMFGEIAKDTLKILPKAKITAQQSNVDKISIELFRNTEGNQVTVKWEDKPGLKYEIHRNDAIIGDSLDGSYTDTNLKAEKTYTYQVVGFDEKTGQKVLESNKSSIQLPKVEEKPVVEEKPAVEDKPVVEETPPATKEEDDTTEQKPTKEEATREETPQTEAPKQSETQPQKETETDPQKTQTPSSGDTTGTDVKGTEQKDSGSQEETTQTKAGQTTSGGDNNSQNQKVTEQQPKTETNNL
ncbi:transglycosylase domain-containing protein [Priestia aryabhattai]|uniref:Transglycosylase domain-containing protein n=1 Tax=Priestia aryabhattai TaxID=412384 RepID=A0AAX6NFE0_PRIAR|nr:transglycosylase domain-containing protein [Priestia aryabhattai]MDU9694225.1 transglycosylase domain-containing protein [Priestia aryabhattai]